MRAAHYSQEAEDMVIGVFADYPELWPQIQSMVAAEDFWQPKARAAFTYATTLDAMREPVDAFSVSQRAKAQSDPETALYVQECAAMATGRASIHVYCKAIREKRIEREIIMMANWQAQLADEPVPLVDKLAAVQEKAYALGKRNVSAADEVSALTDEVIRELSERDGNPVVGIATGFDVLDSRWGGLRKGTLTILAGRPAMGKTTLAINIAEAVAVNGGRVSVFSLEMGSRELIEKMISSRAGVFYSDLTTGNAFRNHVQAEKVSGVRDQLRAMDMVINATGGITLTQIRAECRRHAIKRPLDLVLIDYLQLVNGDPKHSIYERISELTRGFKQMAVELDCPVLLLSQLNRKCDERPYGSNQPVMSDLRDSGSIEQDADVVAFVYRDVAYNKQTQAPNVAEIITAKNRKGVPGTDYLRTELDRSRFMAHDGSPPQYISADIKKIRGFQP